MYCLLFDWASLCPTRESGVRRAGDFPGGLVTGVPCLLAFAISVHLHTAAHGSRSPCCLPDLYFGISDRITSMTWWCIGPQGYITTPFFFMYVLIIGAFPLFMSSRLYASSVSATLPILTHIHNV